MYILDQSWQKSLPCVRVGVVRFRGPFLESLGDLTGFKTKSQEK